LKESDKKFVEKIKDKIMITMNGKSASTVNRYLYDNIIPADEKKGSAVQSELNTRADISGIDALLDDVVDGGNDSAYELSSDDETFDDDVLSEFSIASDGSFDDDTDDETKGGLDEVDEEFTEIGNAAVANLAASAGIMALIAD
jgi:hypothetical protein